MDLKKTLCTSDLAENQSEIKKYPYLMDVLIVDLIVIIISQYIRISNHHISKCQLYLSKARGRMETRLVIA